MRIKISIILFAVVLGACQSNKNARLQETNAATVQMFKNFIAEDTAYMLEYDTEVFHLDTLINEYCTNNNIQKTLVYILNSECSICLAKFFDFLFHFQELKESIPIIVVAETGNKEILKYYTEQS